MKKILLLSLVILVSLSSCKKEKKHAKPIDETIISTTWNTTLNKTEYYNGAGEKLQQADGKIGYKYVFNSETKKVTITDLDDKKTKKDYFLEKANNKDYIVIGTGETSERFEITDYTSKTMSWKQEKPNATYDGGKVAAKSVVSIDFHCPCRD